MAEMQLYRQSDASFPNPKTLAGHFKTRVDLIEGLRGFCEDHSDYADVLSYLPAQQPQSSFPDLSAASKMREGWVYLVQSGDHYKIGRSDEIERRIKEIRIALPEAATLVHAIRTDDPAGIEAYWHRRFADRRANGEWFKLTATDLAAFRRRKFQ